MLCVFTLGACGGGGGGSSSGSDAPPVGTTTGGGTTGAGTTGGGTTGGGTTGGGTTGGGTTGGGTPPSGSYGFTRQAFIDNSLGGDCIGDYDAGLRRCGGGSDTAFASFAAAQADAQPGTAYQIRGGDYGEVLRLRASGRADAYIGFLAYDGETVTLRDVDSFENGEDYGPIWLDGVRYNVVQGIRVRGSVGFLRAVDAHYNVIDGCDFDTSAIYPSESKRGGLYFAWSTNNRVINSRIVRGTDSLALIRSDRNLVSGNTFELAGHDVWVIKCGSYNVIRGNRFTNPRQKLGSIFDCEEATTSWHGNGRFAEDRAILDATRHNLVEGNVFDTSGTWYSSSGGNGIQYAGQEGIVRHNVFVRTNVGLGMTQYGAEALYNYDNRVYHNVFHDNYCAGIYTSGNTGEGRMEGNVYKNNALWDNRGWNPDDQCDGADASQLLYRQSFDGHRFVANGIGSSAGNALVREEFGGAGTVEDFAGDLSGTVVGDPRFTNVASGDYTLGPDSPLIDRGDFLTTTAGAGSGTVMEVNDALYFYDGFGILGEMGDRIQLEGDTATARVVEVDYAANTITLDTSLNWTAGQGVAHAFAGSAPDIGVYER